MSADHVFRAFGILWLNARILITNLLQSLFWPLELLEFYLPMNARLYFEHFGNHLVENIWRIHNFPWT